MALLCLYKGILTGMFEVTVLVHTRVLCVCIVFVCERVNSTLSLCELFIKASGEPAVTQVVWEIGNPLIHADLIAHSDVRFQECTGM